MAMSKEERALKYKGRYDKNREKWRKKAKKKWLKRLEMGDEATCVSCDSLKPLDEFYTLDSCCKECRRVSRAYRRDSVWYKDTYLRRTYGMSIEEWEMMRDDQNNRCAICSNSFGASAKNCHVDHCHDTGDVRGLLCSNCNVGLGMLRDSPDLMLKAVQYLKKHGKNPCST